MNRSRYSVHKNQLENACKYSQSDFSDSEIEHSLCTPFKHAYLRYKSEVYPNSSVTDWLQGLALNVEYNYFDIAEMFNDDGIYTKDSNGNYLLFITDNYWHDMADVLKSEWKKEGLEQLIRIDIKTGVST